MASISDIVDMLNICLQPILFVLNITCNILSICTLSSRALRSSSCTHYILGFTICSMIYMVQVCPYQMLVANKINISNNRYGCKLVKLNLYLPPMAGALMLLLASFDRFCSTSNSVRLRSICTVQKARLFIIITTILLSIFMIPTLIIFNYDESEGLCSPYYDKLTVIYLTTEVLLMYILTPLLMTAFSGLTVYNIRQSAIRARGEKMAMQNRRTKRQISRMLISHITLYGILASPYAVIYCMISLFPSIISPTILSIRDLFITWLQVNCFVSFFIYIVSGKIYRDQLIIILKRMRSSRT